MCQEENQEEQLAEEEAERVVLESLVWMMDLECVRLIQHDQLKSKDLLLER